VEVITPFLDISRDYISVYVKDSIISDDGDTIGWLKASKKAKIINYVSQESKYWNNDLVIDEEDNIEVINFTAERLMPFIQLLIKIQGIIEIED
jgi:hypothetical protein